MPKDRRSKKKKSRGFDHLVHEDDIDKADHHLSKKRAAGERIRRIYEFFPYANAHSTQPAILEEKKIADASSSSDEAPARKSKKRKKRRKKRDRSSSSEKIKPRKKIAPIPPLSDDGSDTSKTVEVQPDQVVDEDTALPMSDRRQIVMSSLKSYLEFIVPPKVKRIQKAKK